MFDVNYLRFIFIRLLESKYLGKEVGIRWSLNDERGLDLYAEYMKE